VNTAAPFPSTLGDFAEFELLSGDDIGERNAGMGSVIGGFLDSDDLELSLCFSAGAPGQGSIDLGHHRKSAASDDESGSGERRCRTSSI
jgi:hypothetical protein